jgi:hypothetical protein
MKKLFLSAALVVAFSLTSFAAEKIVSKEIMKLDLVKTSSINSDGLILKSCTYDIIDSRTFQKIGEITVTDVPNMLPCDDKQLTDAIDAFINS